MSSNVNSRNSPSGGNGSGSNNPDRPRLTDAEKKQNHILSEQKRRQAIRQGFDRLAAMTPGMVRD
jgi:heteromeric Ino2p/Ino4p transcription factor